MTNSLETHYFSFGYSWGHPNPALLLTHGAMGEGTKLTWELANLLGKPVLKVDIHPGSSQEDAVRCVNEWLQKVQPRILNVAGSRASEGDGIESGARFFLIRVFSSLNSRCVIRSEAADFDALRVRYEQALANFRHWDQIRWLVPAWFATLVGVLLTYLKQMEHIVLKFSLGGMIAFAFLCIFLMLRLGYYHNTEIDSCKRLIHGSSLTPYQRDVLLIKLPFDLRDKLYKTATFYLMALIVAIIPALVAWLICAPM